MGPAEKTAPHTLVAYLNGNFKSYFEGKGVPPVKDTTAAKDSLSKINLATQSPAHAGRVVISSNKDGHLIVAGDQEFCNAQNGTPGNLALMLNLVDWLTLNDNLITIRTRSLTDRTIDANLLKTGS